MDGIFQKLAELITQNVWLAPVMALLAGILTSFTPCSLSTIPLIIGCVGGTEEHDTKKALGLSLLFVLGSALTFTVLGIVASLLGELLFDLGPWLHIALAVVLVLMALQMFDVIEILPETVINKDKTRKGRFGAFIAGLFAGAFASHCTTPVLVAMLAMVANRASILYGVMLLVLFSAGHGILSVVAGTSAGFVGRLMANPRYAKAEKYIRIVLGVVICIAAAYLLYEGITEGFLGAAHEH